MNIPEKKKIRLLVVDDSAFIRRAVIRMFDGNPDVQVIDVAADGMMAVDMVKELRPDVVTLDVKMPVLDGLSALERIMAECPTPVVMLSSLTEKGGDNTLKALSLGAVDFVDKSSAGGPMDISVLARELTSKVMVAARVDVGKLKGSDDTRPHAAKGKMSSTSMETEVVLIGTSTGGPPALQTVISSLPESFPAPILIVQHMPVGFTASLAERLDRLCPLSVKEAEDEERIAPGTVYIAPAGLQMKLKRNGVELRIQLDHLPADTLHKPSVDVLFESAAAVCGRRSLAFVLTGMGKDGAAELKMLREKGGVTIAQNRESCIVFGMPGEAIRINAADYILDPEEITTVLPKLVYGLHSPVTSSDIMRQPV